MNPQAFDFTGKRALITGGTQGIGKAAATRFARGGAHVVLNYSRNEDAANETLREFRKAGYSAEIHKADLSKPEEVNGMLKEVFYSGPLDILICNAAYQEKLGFFETDLALMQKTFDVNVFGNFYLVQQVAKKMIAEKIKGRIVTCTSPHGSYVYKGTFSYDVSKAALNHMIRSTALELIPHGIRVNGVDIGWTMTPGERKWFTAEQQVELSKGIPIGRPADSDEIASAIEYLCSDEANYVVGSIFLVDGGFCLKPNPET